MITTIFAHFLNRTLDRYFDRITRRLKIDGTTYLVFQRLLVASLYLIVIIFLISLFESLKTFSQALLVGAGFAGIIIGFAAQETLSNIVSGVVIGISRPFRVGDWINIKDDYGVIEDITLRHTVIRTWDNRRLIIPNSVINRETINNWTIKDPNILWRLDFRIGYDQDIDQVKSIITEEANKHPDSIKHDGISLYLSDTSDFYMTITVFYWVKNRQVAWVGGNEIRESVIRRFQKEGIKFPLPILSINQKGDINKDFG